MKFLIIFAFERNLSQQKRPWSLEIMQVIRRKIYKECLWLP